MRLTSIRPKLDESLKRASLLHLRPLTHRHSSFSISRPPFFLRNVHFLSHPNSQNSISVRMRACSNSNTSTSRPKSLPSSSSRSTGSSSSSYTLLSLSTSLLLLLLLLRVLIRLLPTATQNWTSQQASHVVIRPRPQRQRVVIVVTPEARDSRGTSDVRAGPAGERGGGVAGVDAEGGAGDVVAVGGGIRGRKRGGGLGALVGEAAWGHLMIWVSEAVLVLLMCVCVILDGKVLSVLPRFLKVWV